MKKKYIKLSAKIAITFSGIIFIVCTLILIFLNLSVKRSLENQSILKTIAPDTLSVTLQQDTDDFLSYSIPVDSMELAAQLRELQIEAASFSKLLSIAVIERVTKLSLIATLVIGSIAILITIRFSKRLTHPLQMMTQVTQNISLQNLDQRVYLPQGNDEAVQLVDAFNKTLDKLQYTFGDLEQFNSFASHELRNSLALLRICLETEEADARKVVEQAKKHTIRLSKTVDDIMAITSRQLKDSREPVDIALLAAQAADEYQISGRQIEVNIPEEGVSLVYGKELWLYRVVSNLIDNALKHSPECEVIQIMLKQSYGAVIMEISDHGKGICQEEIENIWKPYYSRMDKKNTGLGLGLAMVKHVIDICGGIVWVESSEGEGSTFYISLPAIASN